MGAVVMVTVRVRDRVTVTDKVSLTGVVIQGKALQLAALDIAARVQTECRGGGFGGIARVCRHSVDPHPHLI